MTADRDSEARSLAVGVGKICKSCLRLRCNGEEVGAFTTVPKGFDWGATRPPYPRAAVREVCAARIDPTAVRKGIDVSGRLALTWLRYSCARHSTLNMSHVRKGVTGPCHP